jgi:hypothetical protein
MVFRQEVSHFCVAVALIYLNLRIQQLTIVPVKKNRQINNLWNQIYNLWNQSPIQYLVSSTY